MAASHLPRHAKWGVEHVEPSCGRRFAGVRCLVALSAPALAQEAETTPTAVQTNLDSVFVLLAAVLVIFMQAGFALVESGLTRAKNVANIMMKNLMDFCAGVIAFSVGGWAALMGAMILGPRIGKYGPEGKPRPFPVTASLRGPRNLRPVRAHRWAGAQARQCRQGRHPGRRGRRGGRLAAAVAGAGSPAPTGRRLLPEHGPGRDDRLTEPGVSRPGGPRPRPSGGSPPRRPTRCPPGE